MKNVVIALAANESKICVNVQSYDFTGASESTLKANVLNDSLITRIMFTKYATYLGLKRYGMANVGYKAIRK